MPRLVRFSAVGLALGYIALSLAILGMLAVPLWYAWRQNIESVRDELLREDAQSLTDIATKQGLDTLVGVINARVASQRVGNLIISLSDPSLEVVLAGNVTAIPNDGEARPQGLHRATVIVNGRPMHAVLLRVTLPGGQDLLLGRSTARFERLEHFFSYALAAAALAVVVVAVIGGLAIRRALLGEVQRMNATASAIVEGDLARRLPVRRDSNELDMLAQTVNRMLDQIEQLVQGVRNVTNSIAHDLRTPLTELRARLETLVITRPPNEHALLEIESAVADVDRVIAIFNALLRLAQIDTGERRAGFVRLDIAEVVSEAAEFYQPLAELKGVTLTCACDTPIEISGDSLLLAQAIGNLIDNAIKYTRGGGRIEVEAIMRDDAVHVVVADDGPGVPAAELPKLTERFYRGDTSRGTPGVGLGLSLVAAVAALHRGRVEFADNAPGLRAALVVSAARG